MTDSLSPDKTQGATNAEVEDLRALCHALETALAKRCLKDANDEREDQDDWPAGQTWDDLVGTSHSIFRHRAWLEAGWTVEKASDLLFTNGYPKPYTGAEE